jgi:hypothetical protein
MRAAALRIEVRLHHGQSLKEKRAVLRPVIEGLRRLVSVSVAEVDHHDKWQRSAIGVAVVATDAGRLDDLITRIHRYFDDQLELEVVRIDVHHMEETP